jgi:hypothetical protein
MAFDSSNLHSVVNTADGPSLAVWVVIGQNQP